MGIDSKLNEKKRRANKQIIAILGQADSGKTVEEVCCGNKVRERSYTD